MNALPRSGVRGPAPNSEAFILRTSHGGGRAISIRAGVGPRFGRGPSFDPFRPATSHCGGGPSCDGDRALDNRTPTPESD
ncbi:hypothetical protein ACHAWF_013186 [Thalassiosira exigua]